MAKKKITNRQKKALETKKRIYDSAFRLIEEKGFENITISEICKASGVAKGSFYTHFKSKDDIVVELYKDVDDKCSKKVKQMPPNTPAFEKVMAAVSFQASYAVSKGVKFTTQIYKSQLESGTKFFISPRRPFYQIIRDSIELGQQNKELSQDIDCDDTARWILVLSRGITYDWCLHQGDYDIQTAMNRLFKMVYKTLRAGRDTPREKEAAAPSPFLMTPAQPDPKR